MEPPGRKITRALTHTEYETRRSRLLAPPFFTRTDKKHHGNMECYDSLACIHIFQHHACTRLGLLTRAFLLNTGRVIDSTKPASSPCAALSAGIADRIMKQYEYGCVQLREGRILMLKNRCNLCS